MVAEIFAPNFEKENNSERAKDEIIKMLQRELSEQKEQIAASALYVEYLRRKVGQMEEAVRSKNWDLAKAALAQDYMEERGNRDVLSGALSRRAFLEAVEKQLEVRETERRSGQEQKAGALVYVDIDHFKKINDTYGHDVGDKAIRALVAKLREIFRTNDIIGRIGGEEFAVFCPGATDKEIYGKILDLSGGDTAQISAEYEVNEQKKDIFTVSGGIIMAKPGTEVGEILKQADDLLYTAKKSGRNRIVTQTSHIKEK